MGLGLIQPELSDSLSILNLPHFRGLARARAHNPKRQQNRGYARRFQEAGADEKRTSEKLAERVTDPEIRAKYVAAFRRSDCKARLNYYKRNYPQSAVAGSCFAAGESQMSGADNPRFERLGIVV